MYTPVNMLREVFIRTAEVTVFRKKPDVPMGLEIEKT